MQVSKVLVVDGDRVARDALVTGLKFVGMEAHGAENVAAARFWLTTGSADVLVLADELVGGGTADFMSPGAAGIASQASILVLTRSGTGVPRPNYLSDDTLQRPVSLSRVVERVESLIQERSAKQGARLHFGALSLDMASERAACEGREVELGPTESRLLAFFFGQPDKVFSRGQLLRRLWSASVCVEERTVDVHIRRLRQALTRLGCAGLIQTVRGSGYRFSAF
jgi:two-component system, OmpR family, phosphate regulon response regulator PhoB